MRPEIWPLLCAFLWLSSSNVSANDTIAELSTGGLVFKKSADISMLSEDLFISLNSIRVKYRFKNNKPAATLVTVAFPLPDIGQDAFENNVAIPSPQHANFLSFFTKVNGVSQETKLELRAVHNGTDFSEHLRHLGVPITTQFAEAELALKNLSVDAKIDLSNLGLVSITPAASGDLITPRWAIKTTYYWEQLFPPKEIVEIEHAYQPSVGRASETSIGGSELGEETDDREHRQKYCVTDSFDRQIGRLKNKRIDVRPFWLTYVLKTGSNWSGPIRQFRLVIERDHPSTFVSFCGQNVRRLNAMQSELRSRNYYPMKDLHILFLKTGSR